VLLHVVENIHLVVRDAREGHRIGIVGNADAPLSERYPHLIPRVVTLEMHLIHQLVSVNRDIVAIDFKNEVTAGDTVFQLQPAIDQREVHTCRVYRQLMTRDCVSHEGLLLLKG